VNRNSRAYQLAQGYTLIEVLVAFSILSLSLSVILLAITTGLRNSKITRDYSYAITLADAKLAEMSVRELSEAQQQHGNFNERFSWQTEVQPYSVYQSGNQNLPLRAYEVKVRVAWPQGDENREVILSTLRIGRPD